MTHEMQRKEERKEFARAVFLFQRLGSSVIRSSFSSIFFPLVILFRYVEFVVDSRFPSNDFDGYFRGPTDRLAALLLDRGSISDLKDGERRRLIDQAGKNN